MKKVKLITACTSLVVILAGLVFGIIYFSNKRNDAKIVTTIFPIYDVCRELMGSDDDIKMLMDNGVDLHSYEPNAHDIATLSKCDVFIYVGGDSDEKWVGNVITSANNVNMHALSLMDEIDGIAVGHDHVVDGGHEHEHTHDEESYDEHIWLSLVNMIKMTEAIERVLIEAFPEKTGLIEENAKNYLDELVALESEYRALFENSDKTIVIADRFPFAYLMHDYSVSYKALFSTCSTESEASAEAIGNIISDINENNCEYIFILENSVDTTARSIINECENKDIEILRLHSCQSVNSDQFDSSSYLSIMKDNLEKFKKAV